MPMLVGPGASRGVKITSTGITVGRERGCDIVLRSNTVSRIHARLSLRDHVPRVEDLNSSNGTRVNGFPVHGIQDLRVGDEITFGDVTLKLEEQPPVVGDVQRPQADHRKAPAVQPLASVALPVEDRRKESAPSSNQQSADFPRFKPREMLMRRSAGNDANPQAGPGPANTPPRQSPNPLISSKQLPVVTGRRFILETCVALFLLTIMSGYLLGYIAQRMNSIVLPGELSARENLVDQDVESVSSSTTEQPGATEGASAAVTTNATPSSVPPSKSAAPVAPPAAQPIEKPAGSPSQNSQDSEPSGVLSMADSAKAMKLMKEVANARVDFNNDEAVMKIAKEKLDMPPEQSRRVLKFVKVLAERRAIIEGSGLKLDSSSKPKPTSSTSETSSTSASPTNPVATANPTREKPVADNRESTSGSATASSKVAAETPLPAYTPHVSRDTGYYLNIWGLVLVLILAVIWQQLVYWMGADSRQYGFQSELWLPLATLTGPMGAILALCCPDFGLGMALNSASLAAPLLGYLHHRDSRVPDGARLLSFLDGFDVGAGDRMAESDQGEAPRGRLVTDSPPIQEDLDNLAGLGCHRKMQGELREIISQPEGLLLICGPRGSGTSTTLRAALTELDPDELKIITIEDPVERRLLGITQFEIDRPARRLFDTCLQLALRKEPDVLMLGDIQNAEMAAAACLAANTGHMVLSVVECDETLTAVQRLLDFGVAPTGLADVLSAVLGQRLIRRLCSRCREAYHPDTEKLRRYRIPSDREATFYRVPSGNATCDVCDGTGYRGRVGIFELMKVDEKIRALIRERASPEQLRSVSRRSGMSTLRENGLRLAVRGITSLEEVQSALRAEST